MAMPSMSLRSRPLSSSAFLSAVAASLSWLSGRKRPKALWPVPTIAARSLRSGIRRQQDAAERFAGLDQLMGAARLGERQRLADDRLDVAARHQGETVLELLSCGAHGAEHGVVAQKKLRRIERHELAGELADQKPAPADRKAFAGRLEERRADIVDRHIDAAPARRLLHSLREIGTA